VRRQSEGPSVHSSYNINTEAYARQVLKLNHIPVFQTLRTESFVLQRLSNHPGNLTPRISVSLAKQVSRSNYLFRRSGFQKFEKPPELIIITGTDTLFIQPVSDILRSGMWKSLIYQRS